MRIKIADLRIRGNSDLRSSVFKPAGTLLERRLDSRIRGRWQVQRLELESRKQSIGQRGAISSAADWCCILENQGVFNSGKDTILGSAYKCSTIKHLTIASRTGSIKTVKESGWTSQPNIDKHEKQSHGLRQPNIGQNLQNFTKTSMVDVNLNTRSKNYLDVIG